MSVGRVNPSGDKDRLGFGQTKLAVGMVILHLSVGLLEKKKARLGAALPRGLCAGLDMVHTPHASLLEARFTRSDDSKPVRAARNVILLEKKYRSISK